MCYVSIGRWFQLEYSSIFELTEGKVGLEGDLKIGGGGIQR